MSRERTCVGSEFQVDSTETENAREVKLLVMPEGLARRYVLEERKATNHVSYLGHHDNDKILFFNLIVIDNLRIVENFACNTPDQCHATVYLVQ